jgi:hypothetical protein
MTGQVGGAVAHNLLAANRPFGLSYAASAKEKPGQNAVLK